MIGLFNFNRNKSQYTDPIFFLNVSLKRSMSLNYFLANIDIWIQLWFISLIPTLCNLPSNWLTVLLNTHWKAEKEKLQWQLRYSFGSLIAVSQSSHSMSSRMCVFEEHWFNSGRVWTIVHPDIPLLCKSREASQPFYVYFSSSLFFWKDLVGTIH